MLAPASLSVTRTLQDDSSDDSDEDLESLTAKLEAKKAKLEAKKAEDTKSEAKKPATKAKGGGVKAVKPKAKAKSSVKPKASEAQEEPKAQEEVAAGLDDGKPPPMADFFHFNDTMYKKHKSIPALGVHVKIVHWFGGDSNDFFLGTISKMRNRQLNWTVTFDDGPVLTPLNAIDYDVFWCVIAVVQESQDDNVDNSSEAADGDLFGVGPGLSA